MSSEGKSYTDLSAAAKETALKSFVSFYVSQYQRGSLEILSSKVSNEVMSSINEILNQNKFMGHAELVANSLRLSKPSYEQILSKLSHTYFTDDGEPVTDWMTAWEEQEEALPTED
ncbi:DUF3368 domain-containing protein [Limosilactobacillus sp.]|uniref:DUF3368 domain-containing protein n=1 Tax=Limosilactobacillus sp. TaxID=2773925 RepID=UPI003F0A7077